MSPSARDRGAVIGRRWLPAGAGSLGRWEPVLTSLREHE